jgi:hypothetical protein
MPQSTRRILKSNDIELEGQFHLDISRPGATPRNNNTALSEPKAHIIEKQAEFAVIEVTCSCGTKTYLRCEYAKDQAPDG